jgi:hypothetical protein
MILAPPPIRKLTGRRRGLPARPPLRGRPDRTRMSDALSDVLRGVRLRGALFFHVSGSSDWAAEAPAGKEIAPLLMHGVEHVMEYHAVAQGSCWAGIPGGPSVRLSAGDVVMFPHGDSHVMSSGPGMRGVIDPGWFAGVDLGRLPLRVAYRGLDCVDPAAPDFRADTTVVCGFLGCDLHPFNPLIAALPHLMHLRASDDDAWLARFAQQAVAESQGARPGGEAMLARMSEMMFVHAVRRYADGLPRAERRLADRPARPLRRPHAGADARAAGARLDHR